MTYSETKEDGRWTYRTEDVFGEMKFISDARLEVEQLDDLTSRLMAVSTAAPEIVGSVAIGLAKVQYSFKRAKPWDDSPEEATH
jgi:hypothetical protein